MMLQMTTPAHQVHCRRRRFVSLFYHRLRLCTPLPREMKCRERKGICQLPFYPSVWESHLNLYERNMKNYFCRHWSVEPKIASMQVACLSTSTLNFGIIPP
ncbi:hypothetical protein ABKV19_016290 [Rosa sericea]